MSSRSKWLNIASWLAPLATVLIATGLDRWLAALRKEASSTFNLGPVLWGGIVTNLVMAALLLLLAWLVTFRSGRNRLPAAFSIIIGVFVAFYPWIFTLGGGDIPPFFMSSPLRELRAILMESGLGSSATLVSSYLILAGLVGLVSPTMPGALSEPNGNSGD